MAKIKMSGAKPSSPIEPPPICPANKCCIVMKPLIPLLPKCKSLGSRRGTHPRFAIYRWSSRVPGRRFFSFGQEPGMLSYCFGRDQTPDKLRAFSPKSNRMTYLAHRVKVEAQVVDGVEDLGKDLVRRVKMTQVRAGVAGTDATGAV